MYIDTFRCPKDSGQLKQIDNIFICEGCATKFDIINGIPRFVPMDNYSASFGFEWQKFTKTQLDSSSSINQSKDRITGGMGWCAEDVKDKLVLDVGCGSGRFSEVISQWGGNIVSLDYSVAVDEAKKNLNDRGLQGEFVQGDALNLPFLEDVFDAVFSIGVLQHTKDPLLGLAEMCRVLKPGGLLGLHGVYERTLKRSLHPKYFFRPITTKIPTKTLFKMVKAWVGFALPISRFMRKKLKLQQGLVERIMAVANYEGAVPGIDDSNVYEWALLDTFDWFSPTYDNPLTKKEVEETLAKCGMEKIINVDPEHGINYKAYKKSI
jgi:ubiquinone/menaquinone biosynthesis C-methylase UbiE